MSGPDTPFKNKTKAKNNEEENYAIYGHWSKSDNHFVRYIKSFPRPKVRIRMIRREYYRLYHLFGIVVYQVNIRGSCVSLAQIFAKLV